MDVSGKCQLLDVVIFYFQDVVRRIENLEKDGRDRPTKDVVIADCGSLAVDTPFSVPKEPVKE